ncbi:SH3 domain-containing protein [Persephonella sp. KM09-Lau-8]|uniref:SH3 domain-containing protein n=1 Tax=Persephonella sp. KM09-Lau-8 TaxID=1158345 RepID=UPI000495B5FE|nr:SH3 domain-containing protein [Persephonella sp. KM09-Lau-8]
MKKLISGIVTASFIITSCTNAQVSIKEKIEERPAEKIINENISEQELVILTMKNLVEDIKKQRREIEKLKAQYGIQDNKIEQIRKINIQIEQKIKKLQDQIKIRDQIISQEFKKLINNQKILNEKINRIEKEIAKLKPEKNQISVDKPDYKTSSTEKPTGKGTVITPSNIRSQPKMGNNIIGYAKKGDVVEIIGKAGNWLKIKYKDKTGFIHKKLIAIQ